VHDALCWVLCEGKYALAGVVLERWWRGGRWRLLQHFVLICLINWAQQVQPSVGLIDPIIWWHNGGTARARGSVAVCLRHLDLGGL
jgi:hypothetical protein